MLFRSSGMSNIPPKSIRINLRLTENLRDMNDALPIHRSMMDGILNGPGFTEPTPDGPEA